MSRFVKDNFVDRRNSTNLRLARSKMAKPTYFLTNCAIIFGLVFHRLSKIYVPLTFFMQHLLRGITILFAQSNLTHFESF